MWDAILTGMEAALLRSLGLPTPKIEDLGDDRREFRAVIVKGDKRFEALGSSPDAATRNVIKLVVRR
jgi:hypothetical protein